MSEHPSSVLRAMRPRHRLGALAAVLLTTVVSFAPAGASTLSSVLHTNGAAPVLSVDADPASSAIEAPVARTEPESGPLLTEEIWQQAKVQVVLDAAASKLGSPYSYSSAGPYAFDCSGFVRWSFEALGVELPHNSVAQWGVVHPIAMSDLRPGDLVFDWAGGGGPDHVGIYVGDGLFIHAPNSGGYVRYDRVGWWTGARVTAGRLDLP